MFELESSPQNVSSERMTRFEVLLQIRGQNVKFPI